MAVLVVKTFGGLGKNLNSSDMSYVTSEYGLKSASFWALKRLLLFAPTQLASSDTLLSFLEILRNKAEQAKNASPAF